MRDVFTDMMEQLYMTITEPVRVNGDGRFDTPGHSATYGTYTMMDADTSKILVSQLVKVLHFVLILLFISLAFAHN